MSSPLRKAPAPTASASPATTAAAGTATAGWRVRTESGSVFGPADVATLKSWAREGRLAPTNEVSLDGQPWQSITRVAELEMDWVAEVSPGTFYGPIHRQALAELSRDGSLPAEAPRFRRQTGDAAPEVTASRERELEARLAEQQHAFAERAAALERDLRAARADAEQARGSTGARDLEREAERQEHQAALARQQAEIVKREARATALEREVERLAALDRERLAAQARLSDLERQVADAEARVVQARQSADAAVAAARQGEKAAEQRLADFREQTVAQRQEHAAMLEKVRLLRQRQESARKLLQQALASMGRAAEAPEPETIDAEPVATPAAAPGPAAASSTDVPPRAGVSLAEIEAQAQRELRHLGSKAAPFLARK